MVLPFAAPSRATAAAAGFVPGPARALHPGQLVAGRYRIAGPVGRGGMGVVYRAHDEELDLDVALKVIRPDLAGRRRTVERFRREFFLARQVTHRNAVRIHDIGQDGDLLFLTMDLVDGSPLRKLLEEGPLAPDLAVDIARQLARVPGNEGWASQVFAWAFLGNARRVGGDLKGAEEAFAQSADLRAEPPASRPELPEPWRLCAKGVHSEARKALALFRRGVDMETVTLEMIRQIVAYLRRAQGDPGLRFSASL